MKYSVQEQLFLSVVKIHPSQEELDFVDGLLPLIEDWSGTVSLLIKQGSAPLFYVKLPALSRAGCIPPEAQKNLQQAYLRTLSRGMVLYHAFTEIVTAFRQQGIEVIALKGVYLSEKLYGDIGLRQLSDIDLLLTDAGQGEKALQVLRTLGYQDAPGNIISEFVQMHSDVEHFDPMVRDEISIELHTKLGRSNYSIDTAAMIAHAGSVTISGVETLTLGLNDLFIFQCIHLDKHFRTGGMQMKSFNDLVNLLVLHGDAETMRGLEKACEPHRCTELVFQYLGLVHELYGAPLAPEMADKYSYLLTDQLRERFLYYLHGNEDEYGTGTKHHILSLKSMTKPTEKLRYLVTVLFPPKSFMIRKYPIRNLSLFWLWYPYRWYKALKSLFNMN